MTDSIYVMDIKKGHDIWRYDPEDKNDVKRIIKSIRNKIKQGFYLYGVTEDGEYRKLSSARKILDDDVEKFILSKGLKKKLVTVPVTGG